MSKIIVYCEKDYKNNEINSVSYELTSLAGTLVKQAEELGDYYWNVSAVLISDCINEVEISNLYKAGANEVILIKNEKFKEFNQIAYANAFIDYFKLNSSDVILFPATPYGRILAPRITTTLDTGLVADCTGIDFILKDEIIKLAATRPTFGSELMATILSKKTPQCATVRPKTFPIKFTNNEIGEFGEFDVDYIENDFIKIVNTQTLERGLKEQLQKAKIVFGAGYGLYEGANSPYIEKIEQLAKKFGATVGYSRKLIDYGIGNSNLQIGQTGVSVAPELYIAFGISGAIQHIQGMKNSKKIIAINSDSEAEIFKYSDFKIVRDARKVIDELLENYNL